MAYINHNSAQIFKAFASYRNNFIVLVLLHPVEWVVFQVQRVCPRSSSRESVWWFNKMINLFGAIKLHSLWMWKFIS
jgi:hypothetical protein